MTLTQIIQEHPGYYWEYDIEIAQWQMRWEPVHRWYSPPLLHPEVIKYDFHVPLWFQDKIGMLIGRQGHNFIKITNQTECYYIYYLSVENKIEIWGLRDNVVQAIRRIKKLMFTIQNNYDYNYQYTN